LNSFHALVQVHRPRRLAPGLSIAGRISGMTPPVLLSVKTRRSLRARRKPFRKTQGRILLRSRRPYRALSQLSMMGHRSLGLVRAVCSFSTLRLSSLSLLR
jgi:hypothetical protein